MRLILNKHITCCLFYSLDKKTIEHSENEILNNVSCIAWMYTNKDYFEVVVMFYDNTCLKEFYLIKNLVYVYKDELKKVGIKSVDDVIALIDLCYKRNDHLNSNSISNRNAINKCSGFAGFALMNLEDKHNMYVRICKIH